MTSKLSRLSELEVSQTLAPQQMGVGYVRLSKEAGDTNQSKKGMVDDIKAKAASDGVTLVDVLIDDGQSGAIRDRPEFLRWLEYGRSGKVSNLYAWHADRITREGVNAAALLFDVVEGKDSQTGRVTRTPVRFADCKGLDSGGDVGAQNAFRLQFLVAAEMARGERLRIVDRNTSTQRRLREARRFRGGPAPYGYAIAPHDTGSGKMLVVNPEEASFVRAAAKFIIDGGSLYGAVQMLHAAGSRPRRAKAWGMPSLRAVLIGDAVLGRMSHAGSPVRDDDGMIVTPWEPILTVEESERVRAILMDPARDYGRGKGRRRASRLLSGIVHCASCGGRMRVNNTNKGDRVYSRYICTGLAQGRGCERPVSIHASNLDQYIEETVLKVFGDSQIKQRVTRMREVVGLAEVEASLRELSSAIAQPGADVASLATQIAGLHARREELLAVPVEPVTEVVGTGQTITEAWSEAESLAKRRELLQRMLTGPIIVRPGIPRQTGIQPERLDIPWDENYLAFAAIKEAGEHRAV